MLEIISTREKTLELIDSLIKKGTITMPRENIIHLLNKERGEIIDSNGSSSKKRVTKKIKEKGIFTCLN